MKATLCSCAALLIVVAFFASSLAGESEKYTLRYKFQPGESVRWEVEHRSNVKTTVSGTTQTAETLSTSTKLWRVTAVKPDGSATFEHSVEQVDMRQKLTGRDEVRYNSKTDAKPPVGFEDAAKSVGVVLSVVSIDAKGKVTHRERKYPKKQDAKESTTTAPAQSEGWMTIPLPEEAVAVGHSWSLPYDIDLPQPNGGTKRIKAVQQFKLEDVKTGVAIIHVSTEILTPITDPAIESQLVQREAEGRVRFDIDAGRIIGQQMDTDKRVVGFRGEASSIHYLNRFAEKLLPQTAKTAGKETKRD